LKSNGYPRNRLFAIDLRNPTARTDNNLPEAGKSSTEDVKKQLAAFVTQVRRQTGAPKVALVGNSRGANTIRNYVKNGGGAAVVSHVVLGGGVNHGVFNNPAILPNNEFNGASSFMKQLNAGPNEVVAGVKFYTMRSDRFDLFAQPDGRFIGLPGVPTRVSYDGPALRGALANVVLPRFDHREASYAPRAFANTFKFITGREPSTLAIRSETRPRLSGRITGLTSGLYNNIGVEGVRLHIYAVNRIPAYVAAPRCLPRSPDRVAFGVPCSPTRAPLMSSCSLFPASRALTSTALLSRAAQTSSISARPKQSPSRATRASWS
jgi:pimeloyl-ACP methyl ester carboxylesterase